MIIVVLYIVFQKKKAAPHVTRSVLERLWPSVEKCTRASCVKKIIMETKLLVEISGELWGG